MEIIKDNRLEHFLEQIKGIKHIKLISPFISENMVNHLIKNWEGESIQVITRFNLNDFRSGISSLKALKKLVDLRAEIKGIKDLHSKAYIFDEKSVIITSANFTNGGFLNNYELGVKTAIPEQVFETLNYFKTLWSVPCEILDFPTIKQWEDIIKKNKIPTIVNNLDDYGASTIVHTTGKKNYFIKFYGRGNRRASLEEKVIDIMDGTHCHFAITFPKGKGDRRPIRYNEGDIVYLARMIEGQEYAIFGKAIARKHDRIRDVASAEDKKLIEWKEEFPIYIRVHSGEFLNTSFKNCPKMGVLMNELGYESFKKTKQRHERGEVNINPRLSLMRKPDIWLSEEGAIWIEKKFQDAKEKHKLINQSFIDGLYQGTPNS